VEGELHPVGVEVASALGRDGFREAGFGHGTPNITPPRVGASQPFAPRSAPTLESVETA
jgi:hypothetical protein